MGKIIVWLVARRLWILRGILCILLLTTMGVIIRGCQQEPERIPVAERTVYVPVTNIKEIVKYLPAEEKKIVKDILRSFPNPKGPTSIAVSSGTTTNSGTGTTTAVPTTLTTGVTLSDTIARGVSFGSAPLPQPDRQWTDPRRDLTITVNADASRVQYTLTQKYTLISAIGENIKKQPVHQYKLYEELKDGTKAEIPLVTTIYGVDQYAPRFYRKATLQAGAGAFPTNAAAALSMETGVAVAVPWLKRGRTIAVEDTRYAFLTPAVTANAKEAVIGTFPVSINLGTIKHVPFTDVWVSPFVGISSDANKKRWGVVISATF